MRIIWRLGRLLLLIPLLAGCVLLGGKPTPLPGIEATPQAAAPSPGAAVLPTATAPPAALPPTPTPPRPTAPPAETATPTAPAQSIVLEYPIAGSAVGNPVELRGRVAVLPFEATLLVRIYDARGQIAAETPIMAQGDYGGPGIFNTQVTYGGVPGAGKIEILDISPKDGSTIAGTVTFVTLTGFAGGGYVETPAPGARVTMPLHVMARVGRPGEQVNVTLAWDDGTQFARLVTALPGLDGRGLVITTLDWIIEPRPPHPPTRQASLQIHTPAGDPLAWQSFTILNPNDAGAMDTNVYWIVGEEVVPERIRIPRTPGIGRASLEALLWGPTPGNLAAYITAIPSPEEVLTYPGRGPDWGERVRLKDLTIINGVARADFSKEILAHPGGAMRVTRIRRQIEQTLLQFSTVNEVVITVEGQLDRLEP